MGRAMRWLKKVLTGKKDGDRDRNKDPVGVGVGVGPGAAHGGVPPPVERRRWSFAKPRNSVADGGGRRPSVTAVVAGELSQVRPCSCGREREAEAAVMIQKAFRGYLARRALRALKSLVKIQALVRGYLVRKQAATTLHRLQALMRLQASSNAMMKNASSRKSIEQERKASSLLPVVHRRRVSDGGDTNFERSSPRIVEMDTCQLRCRSSRITSRYAAEPLPLCSPLPYLYKPPPRLAQDHEPRQPKTTQNTPRLGALPAICYGSPPAAKGRPSCREPSGSPRYMADTASSVARTRCQSAPRQRHAEPRPSLGRDSSAKKTPAPPPPQQLQDSFSFKSSEISRMEDYSEISDEVTRDYYLDQLW